MCVAGACADAPPPAGADVVADAAETTVAAGSAHVEIVTAVSRAGRDGEQRFRGSGKIDFQGRRAHWVLEPGALPGVTDTDLGFEGSVEALSDDLVLYVRAPLPGGAEWLMVDLRSRGLTDAAGLGGPLHGNDPAAHLHLLHGLDGTEEIGRESLRGVPTTRLAGSADLDEAVAGTPSEHRDAVERLVAQLAVSTLPVQVWIDDAGRVRRLSYEVASDAGNEREQGVATEPTETVRTTLEYASFGADVAIVPPAEEEVVTVDGPFPPFDGFEAERGPEGAET